MRDRRLINKIARRLADDLDGALSRNLDIRIEKVICSAATWLFGATPLEIYNYLREKLETEIIIDSDLVEAVGRCFKDNNDFALFYKTAVKQDCLNVLDACNLENFIFKGICTRYNGKVHAEKFVKDALTVMEAEANQNRYANKFFQAVGMFLYVLRFRIKRSYFFILRLTD